MILTLQKDGVLRLYESVEAAIRDVEPLDAEETLRAIFDDTGHIYAIDWIRPNKRRWRWAQNGEYRLVPTGVSDGASLARIIDDARLIEPESAGEQLEEIRRRLTAAPDGRPLAADAD
jgi:hypothetical protein